MYAYPFTTLRIRLAKGGTAVPKLLSLKEVAEDYFGVSKDAFWKRIRRGTLQIPYVQVGDNHKIYFRREVVEAWIDANTHAVTPASSAAS